MTNPNESNEQKALIADALTKAFQLGQTYWRQSDSESYSENRKSDETLMKFSELRTKTLEAL